MLHEKFTPLSHLRGWATLSSAAARAFEADVQDTKSVTLPGVEIHYALMEMPMEAALASLPPSLHPSIPSHMTLTGWRVPESPVGAFDFATMGIGCRAGIRPRMLTTSAFVSNEQAAGFMKKAAGFQCEVADVRTRSGYHGITTTVVSQGREILDVTSFSLDPVIGAGAAIKYCPPLNLVSFRERRLLLQADFGFEYTNSSRGHLKVKTFDGDRLGIAGGPPAFMICGTRSMVDVEMHPFRSLYDLEELSEVGGRVLLR